MGAGIVSALILGAEYSGLLGEHEFAAATRSLVGEHSQIADTAAGLIAYTAAGAAWGALFGAAAKKPTPFKGMAWGIAPTLLNGLVMDPLMGNRVMDLDHPKRSAIHVALNIGVWGCFVGWWCGRKSRKSG